MSVHFELALRPASPRSGRAVLFRFLACGVGVGVLVFAIAWGTGLRSPLALGLVSLMGLFGTRGLYRPMAAGDRSVRLVEDALELPAGPGSRRILRWPLVELRQLDVHGGGRPGLGAWTRWKASELPLEVFSEPNGLPELGRRISARLAALPDGAEALERCAANARRTAQLRAEGAPVTQTLALMVVAAFVGRAVWSSELGPYEQLGFDLRFGALAPSLMPPQWWRAVSGALLHVGPLQLYATVFTLGVAGRRAEPLLGSWRCFSVLAAGAVVAHLSGLGSEDIVFAAGGAGASLALLSGFAVGLVSAPPAYRPSLSWWFWVMSINLLALLVEPALGLEAYLAAVGVGTVAAGGCLVLERLPASSVLGRVERGLHLGVAASVGAGLILALSHAARPPSAHRDTLEQVLLGPKSAPLRGPDLQRAVRIHGPTSAPGWLRAEADARLHESASHPDAPAEVLLVWSERLEQEGALSAALSARWRAWRAGGIGAFPAFVEGARRLEKRPFAVGLPAAPVADLRYSLVSEKAQLDLRTLPEAPASALVLASDQSGQARYLLEWPTKGGEQSLQTNLPEPLVDLIEAGGELQLLGWVAPPGVAEPIAHDYRPGVRWRRIPAAP